MEAPLVSVRTVTEQSSVLCGKVFSDSLIAKFRGPAGFTGAAAKKIRSPKPTLFALVVTDNTFIVGCLIRSVDVYRKGRQHRLTQSSLARMPRS